ncbi:class I SAM-dependent methyltransferase [Sphingobium sp. BYY-5]|uniref:class I SAM-dependent methyltransferase n=1 Tax=Sphingobium sp. BYY-5 TaxID=2926400 RepID=UPI001FA6B47C|nr:methyltransferase domain-containing protein [Sphingobium sp. BYY-5]MCI4590751.1 class I SAM-dependent methyltransferase [Sphingobium sp. BYY-5]
MLTTAEIFDVMRGDSMNDWVGGSDPEAVGDASAVIMRRLLPLHNGTSRVLDFGCGIGRGLVSLRKTGLEPSAIVGMDIMPPVIDFCNNYIRPNLNNTWFELINDKNDHYDRFISQSGGKGREKLALEYDNYFSDGYAFSVFTHVTKEDFGGLLKFISSMMIPGGRFLLTCFELNEFSRYMINKGQSIFPLDNHVMWEDGNILVGNESDPLGFIAFDRSLIEKMAWDAGMAITKVEYGCWMGGGIGSSLQDVMICTKLPELVAREEVKMTPLVDRTNMA